MMSRIKILSTKVLAPEITNGMDLNSIEFQEVDFIETSLRNLEEEEFAIDSDYIIFTSKNAVAALIYWERLDVLQGKTIFCVGHVSERMLNENGVEVDSVMSNSEELANYILTLGNISKVDFVCGNLRRDELPEILEANDIEVNELVVYDTFLNPQEMDEKYDALLFFSPSGVSSYYSSNEESDSIAFCIGNTTADEAKKYTEQVIVSNKMEIKAVLETAVDYYRNI
jgi:uroporphyrinogen-III synthase